MTRGRPRREDAVWYFAHPYTVKTPHGTDKLKSEGANFEKANKRAGMLIQAGFTIFSPVSMCHPIHKHYPMTHDQWVNFDKQFFRFMYGIILPKNEWQDSKGCCVERAYFEATHKEILEVDFDNLEKQIQEGKRGTEVSFALIPYPERQQASND